MPQIRVSHVSQMNQPQAQTVRHQKAQMTLLQQLAPQLQLQVQPLLQPLVHRFDPARTLVRILFRFTPQCVRQVRCSIHTCAMGYVSHMGESCRTYE